MENDLKKKILYFVKCYSFTCDAKPTVRKFVNVIANSYNIKIILFVHKPTYFIEIMNGKTICITIVGNNKYRDFNYLIQNSGLLVNIAHFYSNFKIQIICCRLMKRRWLK